jgi:hypothetical protein
MREERFGLSSAWSVFVPAPASPSAVRKGHKAPVRAAAALLVVLVGLLSVGGWSAYAYRRTWENWLANLKPGSLHSSHGDSRIGRSATGEPGWSYVGDGRAELGEYRINVFDPVTRTTLRANFRLGGLTACGDQAAFDEFLAGNQRFFREQVMVTVRNSDLEDLTGPDQTLLEKKIVSRINRGLGHEFLKSAKVEEFNLFESVDSSAFAPYDVPGGDD